MDATTSHPAAIDNATTILAPTGNKLPEKKTPHKPNTNMAKLTPITLNVCGTSGCVTFFSGTEVKSCGTLSKLKVFSLLIDVRLASLTTKKNSQQDTRHNKYPKYYNP
jgi:hypothetical protein